MSNFDQSSYKTIDSNNISVDIPSKDIFKTDITQKNIDNNIKKYYEIQYKTNTAAFQTSLLNSNSYKVNKIYIYGLLHNNIINITNTSNTDIIGELVIEYIDNNNYKLYTCFLLKKNIDPNAAAIKTENPNKIDDIISYINNCVVSNNNNCASKLTSANVNYILSSAISVNNKFIYYKDNTNYDIIVFLTPLNIADQLNSTFVSGLLNKTDLFDINPVPIDSSSPAPAPDNDIMDCELVGVGTEKTPIDEFSLNQLADEFKRKINLVTLGIVMFGVIILFMVAYVVVPYLFGLIINKNNNDPQVNNKKISSVLVISTIFMVIYVFVLFDRGFKKEDTTPLIVGFILVLIYILSILVIVTQNKDFTFSFNYSTFETLICECVKFTIKNVIPKYIGLFIITIILIAIILSIRKENLKEKYGDAVILGSIYIIPITIILSIVSYSPSDSDSSESCK